MTSISELRKNRNNILEKLQKDIENIEKGKPRDDRYWYPEIDKTGNGSALVRFLPAPPSEASPYVKYYSYNFKGPSGKYYNAKSLTTIGLKDPVAELNSTMWNSTSDENSPVRNEVRKRKRRVSYVSNVLVLKDPANPENEGKVFLYRYGVKVFAKIQNLIAPPSNSLKAPSNPFDFWEGRNFLINIKTVAGYLNYDDCEWGDVSEAIPSGSDEQYESLWVQCHSLANLIDPSEFESYDSLKARLDSVMAAPKGGMSSTVQEKVKAPSPVQSSSDSDDDHDFDSSDDDSDNMEFLQKLISEVESV